MHRNSASTGRSPSCPAADPTWPGKTVTIVGGIVVTVSLLVIFFSVAMASVGGSVALAYFQVLGALLLIITGSIAVHAGLKGHPNLVVATLVMTMISIFVGLGLFIATSSVANAPTDTADHAASDVGDSQRDFVALGDDGLTPPQDAMTETKLALEPLATEHVPVAMAAVAAPLQRREERASNDQHGAKAAFTVILVICGLLNLALLLGISICSCRNLCAPSAPPHVVCTLCATRSSLHRSYAPTLPGALYSAREIGCSMIDPPPAYSTLQSSEKETRF